MFIITEYVSAGAIELLASDDETSGGFAMK